RYSPVFSSVSATASVAEPSMPDDGPRSRTVSANDCMPLPAAETPLSTLWPTLDAISPARSVNEWAVSWTFSLTSEATSLALSATDWAVLSGRFLLVFAMIVLLHFGVMEPTPPFWRPASLGRTRLVVSGVRNHSG